MAPTIAVSDGPSPLSAGNFITISWGAVPHVVGYDVLKLVSNTWMLVGSTSPGNPPATSLTDSGRPTTEYNLPTHNETGHLQVGAFTATDSGATLPLAMPYNGLPGRYVAGVNHRTSLFQSLDSYDIGARIDCTATGGGSWEDFTGNPWLIQKLGVGVTFQTQACSKRNVPAWAAAVTLDFSAGAVQEITLSGATALLFSNILDGGLVTGGRTVVGRATLSSRGHRTCRRHFHLSLASGTSSRRCQMGPMPTFIRGHLAFERSTIDI